MGIIDYNSIKMKITGIFLNLLTHLLFMYCALAQHNHNGLNHWEIPSKNPDRIILTFHGDPATSRAVTWRTNNQVDKRDCSNCYFNNKFKLWSKSFLF